MSEIEYRQQVHKIRKEISNEGLTYYSDMELAYFVDTGKDERRKYVGEKVSSIGTSKRIHILDDLCADFLLLIRLAQILSIVNNIVVSLWGIMVYIL